MLKTKHHKKRIVNKKKQTKNKNKDKNIFKVNANTSTSDGLVSTSVPYPIYPVAQQMFPTITPSNVYNVFTKDPVKSNYKSQNENVRETEGQFITLRRIIPRQNILVSRDDGITFSKKNDNQMINFDNNPPPNLTSQLVVSRSPNRLREQVRDAVRSTLTDSVIDDISDKELEMFREMLDRQGLNTRQIGQRMRRFKDNRQKINI